MNWNEQDDIQHILDDIAIGAFKMYNFEKQSQKIIAEARSFGVTVALDGQRLQFAGDYKGSESVEKSIQRKITNYNLHVDEK